MKHRGRHRRQKRGRALRGVLAGTALALTAAATIVSASQAVSSDNPGPLKSVTSTAELRNFQLKEHLAAKSSLDRLATSMGGTVGVSTVLEHANRTMRDRGRVRPHGDRGVACRSEGHPRVLLGLRRSAASAGCRSPSPPPVTPTRTAAGAPTG